MDTLISDPVLVLRGPDGRAKKDQESWTKIGRNMWPPLI